mmetsp:Transcript_37666/g.99531  ORF Transcript_37666/g.99531 Transcript_37666/m.99531 type:complete len:213 (-) Transcript_37666:289-927(-)
MGSGHSSSVLGACSWPTCVRRTTTTHWGKSPSFTTRSTKRAKLLAIPLALSLLPPNGSGRFTRRLSSFKASSAAPEWTRVGRMRSAWSGGTSYVIAAMNNSSHSTSSSTQGEPSSCRADPTLRRTRRSARPSLTSGRWNPNPQQSTRSSRSLPARPSRRLTGRERSPCRLPPSGLTLPRRPWSSSRTGWLPWPRCSRQERKLWSAPRMTDAT